MVPVLILFFNNPEKLRRVFEQVRKARPSHLFLYQDGPRGEHDKAGISACRKVVEHIDWDCEVHRNYQEVNAGCDPSNFRAQKWAFSHVDKCVVLEDDSIPSVSFFRFCREMLDRYERDERISMISGLNYDEQTPDIPYDYFFTSAFCIWGWASWRRVVDKWDEHYTFLDDDYNMRLLRNFIRERKQQADFERFCHYHRSTGKAYYETIFHAAMFFQSGLAIVPRVNMIQNLGATGETTHFEGGSNELLPRAYRRIMNMRHHDLDFPLRHPRYVIEDVEYKNKVFRVQAWGHPWIKVCRSMEELYLNLRHGNFKRIRSALKNRIRIWMGKQKWD